jgi:predicted nucleic acid-binding protein
VNLYAESSAVLAWLFGEPAGNSVLDLLHDADPVVSSDLTLVECERAMIRMVSIGGMDEAAAADSRARLNASANQWHFWRLDSEIIQRAKKTFPVEPIRTLDALHLASALQARTTLPGLELLSLDDRIRRAGRQLGFRVRP